MAVLKWALSHSAAMCRITPLVKAHGFEEEKRNSHVFVKQISEGSFWRDIKIQIKPNEVLVFMHKEEVETTESYFDYLIQAGYFMGQLAAEMAALPLKGSPRVSDEDEDDED